MKVLILGIDGYIGWALNRFLTERGYEVDGIDNFSRRRRVQEIGSDSLFPIGDRLIEPGDILSHRTIYQKLEKFQPDAIVHLAEQPSAPYSMKSQKEAFETQENNILGTLNILWAMRETCPNAQLVKLGTMGVYGTPEVLIPESSDPYPYDPASFYHNSKAIDSINIRKVCSWWGLNATDIHQGVVYGHLYDTRFDYDDYFGTVVNRFVAQALIGHPLTVYGGGGQTRGFIYLQNTLESLELAIKNPPTGYRVFNQLTEIFSINKIAKMVSELTGAKIEHIDNPRHEKEKHTYKVVHKNLLKLGLTPIYMKDVLSDLIKGLEPYKDRIIKEVILPKTKWKSLPLSERDIFSPNI